MTSNLLLLNIVWTEEYCHTSPNKKKINKHNKHLSLLHFWGQVKYCAAKFFRGPWMSQKSINQTSWWITIPLNIYLLQSWSSFRPEQTDETDPYLPLPTPLTSEQKYSEFSQNNFPLFCEEDIAETNVCEPPSSIDMDTLDIYLF